MAYKYREMYFVMVGWLDGWIGWWINGLKNEEYINN